MTIPSADIAVEGDLLFPYAAITVAVTSRRSDANLGTLYIFRPFAATSRTIYGLQLRLALFVTADNVAPE
jgi:hypothetical protein